MLWVLGTPPLPRRMRFLGSKWMLRIMKMSPLMQMYLMEFLIERRLKKTCRLTSPLSCKQYYVTSISSEELAFHHVQDKTVKDDSALHHVVIFHAHA
mmetsp:Transcript_15650/g.23137  ORF Transcript_15650/g.23137 Transcript_15650/m.23137 type:complete len:97 (-) Transcript_15650:185-475(-)